MGRKNRSANSSRRVSRQPNRRSIRGGSFQEGFTDPRFDDTEESSYSYGDKVKKQRYPQPIKTEGIRLLRDVIPKTQSQELYLSALQHTPLVIGSGTAGSGKTLLAVGAALKKLLNGEVNKIYITRPVVEAGENLGFLPGTMEQKVLPYLLPLLDAVEFFVGTAAAEKLVESGRIEFTPLAFLRGRSLRDSVMILDEAQNCTVTQIKLFLTRIGEGTTVYVTGDPTQSDLKEQHNFSGQTGLEFAAQKFRGKSRMIEVVDFSLRDAVRSELMKEVIGLLDAPDIPVPTRHSFESGRYSDYDGGTKKPPAILGYAGSRL